MVFVPVLAADLYGLTSVDLGSYVLGSWVGMLPGTWAYVHAGAGRLKCQGGHCPSPCIVLHV